MPDTDAAPGSARGTPHQGRGGQSERRQVVVLFADLISLTAFSERCSDEPAYTLMQRISALMTDVVHQQRGTVKSFTGRYHGALRRPSFAGRCTAQSCRAALDQTSGKHRRVSMCFGTGVGATWLFEAV